MSNNKLRIGIIGVGVIALYRHVPKLREDDRVELVAVSRRNSEKLSQIQRARKVPEAYTDWHEMLEKARLDAVVIAAPDHWHSLAAIGYQIESCGVLRGCADAG